MDERCYLRTADESKERDVQNLIILIHGVGVHQPGKIEEQVREVISACGSTYGDVHEFPWESLAGNSVGGDSFVDYRVKADYLARVMSGFRGASYSTQVEDQTAIKSWIARGLTLLGSTLLLGLCLYPIAWFVGDFVRPFMGYFGSPGHLAGCVCGAGRSLPRHRNRGTCRSKAAFLAQASRASHIASYSIYCLPAFHS